ncbi:hypothetical protein L7F22_050911 [Adiantum nelumboides]|nr:hypothetical protein [Adiantum nelumboides]
MLQFRAVRASCSGPYFSQFVVTSAPLYSSRNRTSFPTFQEISKFGGLTTQSSTLAALQAQGVSEQVESSCIEDSSEVLAADRSNRCVKGSAQICRSSSLPVSTDSDTKKKRVAWNKGLPRSEETKEKIRARTRQAMEDLRVRERLRKAREGTTQSSETKLKIKSQLLNFWELRREAKKMQESCLREWEELIADTARRGSDGDVVYQWNSYNILMMELINSNKKIHVKMQKTGRKSADHRRKISEAIRAKWADPDYSERVRRGQAIYFSHPVSLSNDTDTTEVNWLEFSKQNTIMVDAMKQLTYATPTDSPCEPYKDPMAPHKLEKLKQMRSSRYIEEERLRRDILVERAWVLMTEAKRAADALEAAEVKDKTALASLMEARRLLAEAESLFESDSLRMDRP